MVKPRVLPNDIKINSIIRKQQQLEMNRSYKGSSSDSGSLSIGKNTPDTAVFEWRNLIAQKDGIASKGLPVQLFNVSAGDNLSSASLVKEESAMHRLLHRNETQQIGLGATPVLDIYQKIKLPGLKKNEGLAIGEVDGIRCWRFAVPYDAEKVNLSTQTTNFVFDPFDFREF